MSKMATVRVTLLEAYALSYNGWSEIEFHGLEDMDLLQQMIWKKGTKEFFIN